MCSSWLRLSGSRRDRLATTRRDTNFWNRHPPEEPQMWLAYYRSLPEARLTSLRPGARSVALAVDLQDLTTQPYALHMHTASSIVTLQSAIPTSHSHKMHGREIAPHLHLHTIRRPPKIAPVLRLFDPRLHATDADLARAAITDITIETSLRLSAVTSTPLTMELESPRQPCTRTPWRSFACRTLTPFLCQR